MKRVVVGLSALTLLIFLSAIKAQATPAEVSIAAVWGSCASASVSPSSNRVIAIDKYGLATEWEAPSGRFLRGFPTLGVVADVKYTDREDRLLIIRKGGDIDLVNAENVAITRVIAKALEYRSASLDATGSNIALLASDNRRIKVMSVRNDLASLGGTDIPAPNKSDITTVALAPNARRLAVANELGEKLVYELKNHTWTRLPENVVAKGVTDIAFVSDDFLLFSSGVTQAFILSQGKWRYVGASLFGRRVAPLLSARAFLVLDDLGFVGRYEIEAFADIDSDRLTNHWPKRTWFYPVAPEVNAVAVTPNGLLLATCTRTLNLWRLGERRPYWSAPWIPAPELDMVVDYVTRDGRRAAVSDNVGRTAVWNIADGAYERQFPPTPRKLYPNASALSDSGTVYATFTRDGLLTIFQDGSTAQRVDHIPLPYTLPETFSGESILYSSDEKLMFVVTPSRLERANLGRGRPTLTKVLDSKDAGCSTFSGAAAVSPDGSLDPMSRKADSLMPKISVSRLAQRRASCVQTRQI